MAEVRMRSESQNRNRLADVVPLDTPYVLGIYTGDICNFRCKYCIQSTSKAQEYGLIKSFLTWNNFLLIAQQMREFPHKIKKVLFSSMGEPLLNPYLPNMVAYLSQRELAESYEIVTNASKLTPELSRNLIDAGLSRLCISIQGITEKSYKEICGYDIDFEKLVTNIKYFYQYSSGKCKVHIKTVDIALSEGDEERFFSIFQDFCDTIFIDNVVPAFPGVDYTGMISGTGIYGGTSYSIEVCPTIFYTLYVIPDGTMVSCCDAPYPVRYGHVKENTLVDAWNGEKRKNFLKLHLKKRGKENAICNKCTIWNDVVFLEDVLDCQAEEISRKIFR